MLLTKIHLETKFVVNFFFKTQISIEVLLMLFPRHTSASVPLAPHGVDSVQVFKVNVKDQHLF